jgi:hypothetical protein
MSRAIMPSASVIQLHTYTRYLVSVITTIDKKQDKIYLNYFADGKTSQ